MNHAFACILADASEIQATVFSTIVASVIASIVAVVVGKSSDKAARRRSIDDLIIKVAELTMEYPILENQGFCDAWTADDGSRHPDKMRYDNYCCIVFNLIERVWKHCDGDEAAIREILHVPELIQTHRKWWQLEEENFRAYEPEFCEWVDLILNRERTRERSHD